MERLGVSYNENVFFYFLTAGMIAVQEENPQLWVRKRRAVFLKAGEQAERRRRLRPSVFL